MISFAVLQLSFVNFPANSALQPSVDSLTSCVGKQTGLAMPVIFMHVMSKPSDQYFLGILELQGMCEFKLYISSRFFLGPMMVLFTTYPLAHCCQCSLCCFLFSLLHFIVDQYIVVSTGVAQYLI